jgi:FMN reductase [NAD(P)H]
MNSFTKQMKTHKSIRQFSDKEVSNEIVMDVLTSIQQQSTSIGAQQSSVIVTRDKDKISKIASDVTNGQTQVRDANVFMIFCIDYNKTKKASKKAGFDQVIHETLEGLLVGTVDVGIMVEAAQLAFESHGLGTVMIGAIRNNPEYLIDMFNLPQGVFPVVGLSVGHPEEGVDRDPKPRLDISTFAHFESYNDDMDDAIDEYDKVMENYNLEKYNVKKGYSESVGKFYSSPYYRQVVPILNKQGFKLK